MSCTLNSSLTSNLRQHYEKTCLTETITGCSRFYSGYLMALNLFPHRQSHLPLFSHSNLAYLFYLPTLKLLVLFSDTTVFLFHSPQILQKDGYILFTFKIHYQMVIVLNQAVEDTDMLKTKPLLSMKQQSFKGNQSVSNKLQHSTITYYILISLCANIGLVNFELLSDC